jgi:RNA polymerase sigma factor (sigma-70 family)
MTENQLIEQYQSSKNLLIRDQLYEEKKKLLEILTSNLVKNLFPNICLEKQDFLSYSYLSFMKCLNTFNTKQKRYSFTQALITVNRSMLMRYGGRMLQTGQQVLNAAYSLENSMENRINCAASCDLDQKVYEEIEIEKLYEFLKPFSPISQQIVKYKIDGYTNEEISEKLHIKAKAVANRFSTICKKYRKLYV